MANGLGLEELPPAPPALVTPVAWIRPRVRVIGRQRNLEGRTVGILIDEGSDARGLRNLVSAVETPVPTPGS